MAEEIEYWDFTTQEELTEQLVGDIGFIIESALDARGQALLAFPGGSTPKPVFAGLAKANIRWKNVTIIPTDERLVPVDSPLSNVALIARTFLPLGARVLPLNSEAENYKLAGSAANARLMDLHWPPDLVWLGMGKDGHAASIFPGPDMDGALHAAKGVRAVGVMPDPLPSEAPVARVTLTAEAIASARTTIIVCSGSDKKAVLDRAIAEGAKSAFPIGQILARIDIPVDVYWLDN